MDILSDKNVKARKKHTCSFCGREIQVGETYRNTVIKDGDLYDWKIHLYCDELTQKLNMYDNYDNQMDGLTEQDFHDYVWYYFSDNYDNYKQGTHTWEEALRFTLDATGIICI